MNITIENKKKKSTRTHEEVKHLQALHKRL